MNSSEINITTYEPWMKQQLIELTEREYPFMRGWFVKRFEALYESEFQRNKNHIVIALENEKKVVGSISYITWPVSYRGKLLNAFQMVGLIVDPAMRGRGLFKKILVALDEKLSGLTPDIVLGYPVEISKQGFIKQGWDDSFNLIWHVKPISVIAVLRGGDFTNKLFEQGNIIPELADDHFQTAADKDFWLLRSQFTPIVKTYHQTYKINNFSIQIIFRIQKRSGLNVAVLGKIYSGNATKTEVVLALKLWLKELRKNGGVVLAATAVNIKCNAPSILAIQQLFYKTKKSINVIIKNYNNNEMVLESDKWNLLLADMETW